MKKSKIIVFAIALVLILGVELYLFVQCSRSDRTLPQTLSQQNENTEQTFKPLQNEPAAQTNSGSAFGYTSPPYSTKAPTQQLPPPTAEPVTQEPTATAVPQSAPPTAEPPVPETAAPVPQTTGSATTSGSASSNTGTGLNMTISWQSEEIGGGTTRLSISGTVQSYSLQIMSQPVAIQLGGYSTSVMGNSINVTEDNYTETPLFSAVLDVPSGTTGTLTVTWNYQGTYSGVSMSEITASGFIG